MDIHEIKVKIAELRFEGNQHLQMAKIRAAESERFREAAADVYLLREAYEAMLAEQTGTPVPDLEELE